MINEKKKIMKAKLKINEIKNQTKSNNFLVNLMIFYHNILKQTSSNLWWMSISIILQYLHLILFALHSNVS